MKFRSLFLSFSIFVSGVSSANTWTQNLKIENIRTENLRATSLIQIENTCVSDHVAYIDPAQENSEKIVSLVLAAMLANKEVKLLCSSTCASTDRCRVVDIQVFN